MPGAMPTAERRGFRFDGWEVDVEAGECRKGPRTLKLHDKPFQVLLALLEHPGVLVSRDDLCSRLWSNDTYVVFDDNLNHAVQKLRQGLGDAADRPRYIETVPRRGYRFIAPVERWTVAVARPGGDFPDSRSWLRSRHGRLWMTACALVLAVVGYAGWRAWQSRDGARPRRVMLAVLPLENLSGSPDQDYLADGLTEEVITGLGRLSPVRLGVIARTSVLRYRAGRKSIAEIGRELGVDYVLEGSARRDGTRVRVNLQLIRVSDQTHVWADAYESEVGDLLAVERSVAEHTSRTLSIELLESVQHRLASSPVVPADARDAYLRGRFLLGKRTGPTFEQARDQFLKAAELAPAYPDAYSGLAIALMLLPNYQAVPVAEAIPAAKAAALKALALDPTMAEARVVLAQIASEFEWDFTRAEREFGRVLRDAPNEPRAHSGYAAHLWAMGRVDEALEEMRKVVELAPVSPGAGVDLGRAYYFARQYDRAIAQYHKVIDLDPDYAAAHSMLGMALLEKRQYDAAIAEIQRGAALGGGQSIWLAYAYGVAGRRAEAALELTGCLERWNTRHTGGVCIALAYTAAGDRDRAFAWLDTELLARSSSVFMIKAYPYWDSLRADPRYTALLERAGLPLDASAPRR
jgi:TolB-like protein/DNA-binding winged helix-turn-helix (wHTH) protein/Flp pilus assembly protein TadD